MTITRIIPEVRSNNLAETRDFYTGILGLVIDMEEGDFLMMSSPANTSAQLVINDNGHAGLPPGFAVDVGNTQQLQQIYQSVIDRGLPIVEPLTDKPWGIRRFSVIDPTGVRVTVISLLTHLKQCEVCFAASSNSDGPLGAYSNMFQRNCFLRYYV